MVCAIRRQTISHVLWVLTQRNVNNNPSISRYCVVLWQLLTSTSNALSTERKHSDFPALLVDARPMQSVLLVSWRAETDDSERSGRFRGCACGCDARVVVMLAEMNKQQVERRRSTPLSVLLVVVTLAVLRARRVDLTHGDHQPNHHVTCTRSHTATTSVNTTHPAQPISTRYPRYTHTPV